MICFVILHYKSIEETLFCLDCLKKTFNENKYKAIVVDNNSLDKYSVKKIKQYTEDIVLLNENKGYAKANNIGCNYAKEKYNPLFIAVINNDVFITQKEFIKIINNDYKKYKFDMLGPKIDSPSKESCNPFPIIFGKEAVEKRIKRGNKLIRIYKNPVLYWLLNHYIKIKHFINKPIIPTNGKTLEKQVGLHGCAIIFSKKYFNKYNDAFYNGTFLFHEEEFLYNRVIKDKLISIYDPELNVFHKEGSSLNKTKELRKSKLFREEEKVKSLRLLLKEIDNES